MSLNNLAVLCFVLVLIKVSKADSNYCLSSDKSPYNLFGTKTSYDFIRGTAGTDSTCTPVQIWSINRHGTRISSNTTLQQMKRGISLQKEILENYQTKLPSVENRLCEEDIAKLAQWSWDSSVEEVAKYLTAEGWRELKEIGQRYQRRYPDLMSNYSDGQLYFRHTDEQRTWASCRAFIEGLFGSYESVPIDPPRKDDQDIRPYKHCAAWVEAVEANSDFKNYEKSIFREQVDYRMMRQDLSERLGLKKLLDKDDIYAMYDLCRYSKSWFPKTQSVWCSIFRKHELFLMEYYEDLNFYYKSGYSHEFNPKLGCMPLKNLIETFEKTVDGGVAYPKGVFYFSHDTMLNLMFTALGYMKDDKPLKGTDYDDLLVSRNYRMSINTPFAANVAAVLYRCTSDFYQIQLFINERPMVLEGCPQGLCSWKYFINKYASAKSCNLDFCENSSRTTTQKNTPE